MLRFDRDSIAREAVTRGAGFGLAGSALIAGTQVARQLAFGPKKPKVAIPGQSDLRTVLGASGRAPIGATTAIAKATEREAKRVLVYPRGDTTTQPDLDAAVAARSRIDAGETLNRTLPALVDTRGRGERGRRAAEKFLGAADVARGLGVELPSELQRSLRDREDELAEVEAIEVGEPPTERERTGAGLAAIGLVALALL